MHGGFCLRIRFQKGYFCHLSNEYLQITFEGVYIMENILRKSAFYGFLLGLGYAILFTKYKEVTDLGEGVSQTTYFPVMDYVVTILRYGVWGAVVALLGAWLIGKRTIVNEEAAVKTYYLELFLGVFVFCLIIGTLFNL